MPTRFQVRSGTQVLSEHTQWGDANAERARLTGSVYPRKGDTIVVVRVGSPDYEPPKEDHAPDTP